MPNSYWNNIFETNGKLAPSLRNLLLQVPVFSELKKGELKEFERIIHHRYYKKNEVIFYDGEPGVGMYVIEFGAVGIYKELDEGAREELATLQSGEFFGEMSLLDDSPRSATAIALEDAHILSIFRPDLFSLFERKPRLGNKILLKLAQMIAERLRLGNVELQDVRKKLENAEIIR